jgi:hypothetical protein
VPNIILALNGYKQAAPNNVDTAVGFKVTVKSVTFENFDVDYYIYGGDMVYLIYTFVAINSNDYFTGFYTYVPSAPSPSGSYSFDVANNGG